MFLQYRGKLPQFFFTSSYTVVQDRFPRFVFTFEKNELS